MGGIIPAILCGGSGTRLWPLSRASHPKQFVDLGDGRTLFKDTLERLKPVPGIGAPVCICNEKHRFFVEGIMRGGRIILEPCARGTAPAIALAALSARPDDLLLALPADHYFAQDSAFAEAVARGIAPAREGRIVVFGAPPAWAATGYGYIRAGQKLGDACFSVDSFVEKPDAAAAQAMLAAGGHFWNIGIFMARPDIFLEELGRHAPDILAQSRKAWGERTEDANILRPGRDAFASCPEDSIDYAVMQRTRRGVVIPVDCAWSDLGSWDAFHAHSQRDGDDNAASGHVLLDNVKSCYVNAGSRLVAAIGVENLAIIETADAVLVADRARAQSVRGIVEKLKCENAPESERHRLVPRPWGSYEILAEGSRFQVKRIVVRPRAQLSLQMHHHRAEHWIVVSGTAEVSRGDETAIFTENQSTYIPVGVPHRLRNPGLIPLVMIEIQSGSYLGEDDIVRLEDGYCREGSE